MKRRQLDGRVRRRTGTNSRELYPEPRTPFDIASPINALAAEKHNYMQSRELRAFGLLLFMLMADWKAWTYRRVETITFDDPDTVRLHVSVDFAFPALPDVLELDGKPLQFVPLGLLRKRRLTQFDLYDESGKALALLNHASAGVLAAATLAQAAQALAKGALIPRRDEHEQGPRHRLKDPLPAGNLTDDFWDLAHLPAVEALETWRRFAQTRADDTRLEADWRSTLVNSWRFLTLANDLTRNFMVLTPASPVAGVRRILKFAYTEQAQLAQTALQLQSPAPRRRLRQVRELLNPNSDGDEPGDRCTLTIRALEEPANRRKPKPLNDLRFHLEASEGDPARRVRTTASTRSDGTWIKQIKAADYELVIDTPPGLMLTGRLDQSQLRVDRSKTIELLFRPAPDKTEHQTAKLSPLRNVLRLFGLDAKTLEITAPTVGQARSYHLEYIVPEGMLVTSAKLTVVQAARVSDFRYPANPPAPDLHATTAHRVHLHHSNVPQEYTALAEIALRPRTSTIVRGATGVSLLSLLMIGLLTLRWQHLGVTSIGTEVALLLAVPGGLSAYVARSPSNSFTGMVLMGLRGLALASIVWCAAAAALIATARGVHIGRYGVIQVGHPWGWAEAALVAIICLNFLTLCLLSTVWWKIRHPPEAKSMLRSMGVR